MQMARNITNKIALNIFGSIAVTVKRTASATLVVCIVAKFNPFDRPHLIVE